MDNAKTNRKAARRRRAFRVRNKLRGTSERPRLSISKTNKHIYAQLIDDERGISLAGVGTRSKENQKTEANKKSKEAAKEIGKQIAHLAKKRNISAVIFDRGISKYHGVIAELAQGAREAGLKF